GFFLEWDDVAEITVGSLRAEAGRNPLDKSLTDLIGELTARSHPFATMWAAHNVRTHRTATKRFHNSVVGQIELTGDALDLSGDGLTIIAYTAEAGSTSAEKLALLASWRPSSEASRPADARGVRGPGAG
ncbi:MAG TPA: transcriptional regulator, partial [Propionibacteriaceae bacterium]|nr:transcriptional regulator [Propionibacteriaceae bacterium]